ncbi:hypothetical protein V2A60_001955 [Cordyceps javanica]
MSFHQRPPAPRIRDSTLTATSSYPTASRRTGPAALRVSDVGRDEFVERRLSLDTAGFFVAAHGLQLAGVNWMLCHGRRVLSVKIRLVAVRS